jgi:hypothetical protein
MGDIINLNKFRKERQRATERRTARDNRARFGRTGADKATDRHADDQAERALDGKKLEQREGKDTHPETPAPPKAR